MVCPVNSSEWPRITHTNPKVYISAIGNFRSGESSADTATVAIAIRNSGPSPRSNPQDNDGMNWQPAAVRSSGFPPPSGFRGWPCNLASCRRVTDLYRYRRSHSCLIGSLASHLSGILHSFFDSVLDESNIHGEGSEKTQREREYERHPEEDVPHMGL